VLRKFHKSFATAAAGALAAGALIAPAIAQAKTYNVVVRDQGTLKGIKAGGKLTGSPFGNGTVSGTVKPPVAQYVWHFQGGTVKVKWVAKLKGQIASGNWKILGGTGKYKGIKGGGHGSGNVVTGKLKFTGKATF
jgi:hypothetical protein